MVVRGGGAGTVKFCGWGVEMQSFGIGVMLLMDEMKWTTLADVEVRMDAETSLCPFWRITWLS